MKRTQFFWTLILVSSIFCSKFNAQVYGALEVAAGFTDDVIANGVGPAAGSTTNDVDGGGYALLSKDFQANATSALPGFGLPVNGQFYTNVAATPGLYYQLASYSGLNAMRLNSTTGVGLIQFAPTSQKAVKNLYMLAMSGDGSSTVDIQVVFTDNTTQSFTGVTVADWYWGIGDAIRGIGRVTRATDALDSAFGNNPRLYQINLDIDAANEDKLVSQVVITYPTGTSILNIFGFSAEMNPTCQAPSAMTATVNSTTGLADLAWTAPTTAPAMGYDIYYTTTNTPPAATAVPNQTGVTTATAIIGPLTLNTDYYVWVRSVCSATNNSGWVGPISAYYGYCKPAPSSVDNQGITNVTFGTVPNIVNNTTGDEPNHYGDYSALIGNIQAGVSSQISITYTTDGYTYGTKIWVDLNNDYNFDNATELFYTGLSAPQTPTTLLANITLPATTTPGNYRMRIGGTDNDLGPDDACYSLDYGTFEDYTVNVSAAPSCAPPSALVLDSITSSTATVSWMAPATAPANGYVLYYSTTNTAPTASTVLDATNSVTSTSTTATINGLTLYSTYYVWLRSVCSTTDSSPWIGSVVAYIGHCTPFPISVDGDGITNVTFGNAPNIVNNTTGDEPNHYGNYSALIGNIQAGVTSQISITYATGYTYGTKIWVDLNNDLAFDNATELFYTGLSTSQNPTTLLANITLPITTIPGMYRMRIGGTDDDSGPGDACYSSFYGTFEDYTVNVLAAPSCLPPSGISVTVTTTQATVNWVASTSNPAGYNIYVNTVNAQPTTATYTGVTGTSQVIPGTHGTVYYVWIVSDCGGTSSPAGFPLSYQLIPANDDCANAKVATPPSSTVPFVYSQTDGSASTNNAGFVGCNGSGMNDGLWFTLTGDGGNITVNVTNVNGWDPEIGVYSGTCAALACVGTVDNGGNSGDETYTFLSVAGTTYYINVGHYSGFTNNPEGPFDISVSTDAVLGTNEIVKDAIDINVYPNPFTDVINISDVKNVKSISVTDMSGRVVRTIAKPENKINLSQLESGMYILSLQYDDSTIKTVKVIKK